MKRVRIFNSTGTGTSYSTACPGSGSIRLGAKIPQGGRAGPGRAEAQHAVIYKVERKVTAHPSSSDVQLPQLSLQVRVHLQLKKSL